VRARSPAPTGRRPPLPRLLRRSEPADETPPRAASRHQDAAGGRGRRLLCAGCRAPITDQAEAIEVAGAHHHRQTNPAGLTFDLACFARAPGCAETGPATAEHSWFPGYRWRIAVCRGCGGHLGWGFRGPDHFFGLIRPRLREERE